MATNIGNSPIWGEIDRCESYLVCSMYEEAAATASSVLKRLCDGKCIEAIEKDELNDMLESAGMVLVQSLKELKRTAEILRDLKSLFGSVTYIPVQVFLTGVCLQISEGPSSGVREFLDEFLRNWSYVDGRYYTLAGAEVNLVRNEGSESQLVLAVDKYIEMFELYVVKVLAVDMDDMEHSIIRVEEAALPDEKRQELLRRLHSISSKVTSSSQISASSSVADDGQARSASIKDINLHVGSKEGSSTKLASNGENLKQTLLKFSGHRDSCFWWFRTIKLKFGNRQFVISNGNISLGCLLVLVYYLMRRKQTALKSAFRRQASAMKKALVDLWQLAFSYQVNPLAAVQPLPTTMLGSR